MQLNTDKLKSFNTSKLKSQQKLLSKSVLDLKKDIIVATLDVRTELPESSLADKQFKILSKKADNLVFNNVSILSINPFTSDSNTTIPLLQVELQNRSRIFEILLNGTEPFIEIKNNIAYITTKDIEDLSFKDDKQVSIKFANIPFKVLLNEVYDITNLQKEQIRLALDPTAFIIKTRTVSSVTRKVGKPKDIAITKTINVPTPAPRKERPVISVNETNKPIILDLPDDGFKRIPCHNFVVAENSRGQLEKNITMFKQRADDYNWPGPRPNPYRNILITPVALPTSRKFLHYLRELREKQIIEHVMFDSGGFQVMTGSLPKVKDLDDLLEVDRQIYTQEDWADIYILPDYPPVGEDSFGDAEEKIIATVDSCLEFADKLPDDIKSRCVPVFHAKYIEQLDYFYEAYKPLIDVSKMATYSAAGKTFKDKPRQLNTEILRILQALVAKLGDASLHCLGIASPPAVFCLAYLGVRTYDSSTATKVAATGKVLFPWMTAKPCSHRRPEESITERELEQIKEATNHYCPFCEDINELKESTDARRLHNLIVLDELNWHYRNLSVDELARHSSSNYKNSYVNRLAELGSDKNQLAFH